MKNKNRIRFFAAFLAFFMTCSSVLPAYAAEIDTNNIATEAEQITEAEEETEEASSSEAETETETAGSEEETETEASSNEEKTEAASSEEKAKTADNEVSALAEETEVLKVSDYDTFMKSLVVLEGYAKTYASEHAGEDAIQLVLNYIRTGVKKYTDGNWTILAGAENTAFTAYVAEQDKINGTEAAGLRNLTEFKVPNGDNVEFAHMFGCMDITYYMAQANPSKAIIYADLGGWGGDLCDLLTYSVGKVKSTDVEAMADEIRENYLGVDDPNVNAFGILDIYGDLDAYYIMNNLTGAKTLSTVMKNYFNNNLSEKSRALYFVKNRFPEAGTQEEIREAVYTAYSTNTMIKDLLEGSEGLSNVDLERKASCYAFADYLYNLTGTISSEVKNDYYSVFSTEASTLAPGVTQKIHKANTADNKQIVYYVATADVARSDVSVYANYNNNTGDIWAMSRVMDQMNAAIKNHTNPESDKYIENYTPVVGTNADFFNMTTGEPSGALVMEGVKYHSANNSTFFAMLKDGTPILANGSEWSKYEDDIVEAVGGSTWLVKNGKLAVTATSNYYTDRASRTCVGITADNKVVLMVLDGRQEPVSAGGSAVEIAQIMLDAGCVSAINLDGGGSTTYIAKEEGSDELSIVNNPSDGYARSVSSSLMIVSTARPSTEFDHAIVTADYDYLTVGTSVKVEAVGVTTSGGNADLPEGVSLKVSDESIGTIKDGVFTAKANGDVTIQLVSADGSKIYGKKTLHVVVPDTIAFTQSNMNAVYGIAADLPIYATYKGINVAINRNDIMFGFVDENMNVTLTSNVGTFSNSEFTFTGNEASNIRSVRIGAVLLENTIPNMNKISMIVVNLFKENEAVFDFENATFGDRQFAMLREMENTYTVDDFTYYIGDPYSEVEGSYTFGLDMKEIDIPEKLAGLTSLLPGGDSADATAWGFLLQLAERVSVLTTVEISLTVDPNFDLDYSNLTFVNEYFWLEGTKFDEETNTLTMTVKWIDQEAAVDPATANSICIMSGLKFTPKKGTPDVLEPVMKGEVRYDIYLRANALYGFAQDEANQEQFGVYPFENTEVIIGGTTEKGAHFESIFATFNDTFILDKTGKNGWVKDANGKLSYYVDNDMLYGIQKVPGYLDEENEFFYDLGDDGISKGKVTGLFEYNTDIFYAISGKPQTGWHAIQNANRVYDNYYFDPATGAAVNGAQKIDGYDYVFTNHVLTRGDLVTDSKGTRYRWAGDWATQAWLTIDGNVSYAQMDGYFMTGIKNQYSPEGVFLPYVCDENGVWLQYYTGLYDYEGGAHYKEAGTYYVKDGIMVKDAGLVAVNGNYYYISTTKYTAVKDCNYWITKTNGLLPVGNYTFDKAGKLVGEVKPPKNGWIEEKGSYSYYVEDVALTGIQKLPGHDDPAKEYYYDLGTNGISKGKVNGFFTLNKNRYYAVNGILKEGWATIKEDIYYFTPGTGVAVNGEQVIGGYTYQFTDYILTAGQVVTDSKGSRYIWAGEWVTEQWIELGSNTYYAQSSGYFATNLFTVDGVDYVFGANGAWDKAKNGLYDYKGKTYLIKDGCAVKYAGLVKVGNDYYYFDSSNTAVKDGEFVVEKTNNLMAAGTYEFDKYGKMISPQVPDEPVPVLKNGIVAEEGSFFYYVDDVRTYAGLIKIDGAYYYVRTSGELAHSRDYWITKTNGLLSEKSYTFDETGKIVMPGNPDDDKNGIVAEEGSFFYYVDGARTYAGLIAIDGYYYYVRTSGELAHSTKYWTTKNNDLLPQALYTFDEEGRMLEMVPQSKNGIVAEEGSLFYYVNDVRTYAGLIKVDGAYYYVRTSGELAHSRDYWITKTNGLLPEKSYTFDKTGKIVMSENPDNDKNGIVAEEGSLFYYVDGVRTYAGLIKIDGAYYYVRTSGELAHSRNYWITKTNGLLSEKSYTFDRKGKIVF